MADALSFAELERRNRATARAKAIFDAASAILGNAGTSTRFRDCVADAEREWEALHARCVAAEPASDETEFAFGLSSTAGVREEG